MATTTQDPVATHGLIARGLGVGWIPGLLADDHTGIAIRRVAGNLRTRDVYALVPPGARHPLAGKAIAALRETAADLAEADPELELGGFERRPPEPRSYS